jgi:hypothetical protein
MLEQLASTRSLYNGREFLGDSHSYRGLYMYVHVCLSTAYITLSFFKCFVATCNGDLWTKLISVATGNNNGDL